MGRAELRRVARQEKKEKTVTYNLTKNQLNQVIRSEMEEEFKKIKQEATDQAVNTAMILLLSLPMKVLMDHYWTKSYAKRIPEFNAYVLEYYEQWQNGELSLAILQDELWEYAGIRLEEGQ